jgi:hypothetical protein
MKRHTAVWKFNSNTNAYTDLTSNVNTNTAFNFISDAADTIYFGLEARMLGLIATLTTNGSYTSLVFKYKAGSGWKSLQLIDSYAFDKSKYLRWVLPDDAIKFNFTELDPYSATPPDNVERYWISVSCSAVTTAAVISKLRAIPYVMYSTPAKVAEFMQLKKSFDNDTFPTDLTVEDYIRRAEDRIDYLTKKSWRFNIVSTENSEPQLTDYNRYGVFLRHRNFLEVYSVSIWNGGAWDKLTEGRNNDYFVNYNLGMIYFTRLFLLPAAYGMTGRYFHWGFGEYKHSCQVEYSYGRDWEVDTEKGAVELIATMMAAKSVYLSHDYSSYIVSGSDKVPLESKIRTLDVDIERGIEELTGIQIY